MWLVENLWMPIVVTLIGALLIWIVPKTIKFKREKKIKYRSVGRTRFDRDYNDGEIIPTETIDPKAVGRLIRMRQIERIEE